MILSNLFPSLLARECTTRMQRNKFRRKQSNAPIGSDSLARHPCRDRRRRELLVGEALAINAQVFADPFDIVARLIEGNALDPIDEVDRAFAWIAMRRDPLSDSARPGVVRGERKLARAPLVFDQLTQERGA